MEFDSTIPPPNYVEFGPITGEFFLVIWKDAQNAIWLDVSLQVMLLLGGRMELEINVSFIRM